MQLVRSAVIACVVLVCPSHAVLGYCLAHLLGSCVYTASYYIVFHRTMRDKRYAGQLPFTTLRHLLPSRGPGELLVSPSPGHSEVLVKGKVLVSHDTGHSKGQVKGKMLLSYDTGHSEVLVKGKVLVSQKTGHFEVHVKGEVRVEPNLQSFETDVFRFARFVLIQEMSCMVSVISIKFILLLYVL